MTDALVDAFLAARRDRHPLAPPSETRVLSMDEAYRVQDRLREALVVRGDHVIGWKAGFTSKGAQAQFGVTEPVSGFLLASDVFPSGADVPYARFVAPGVEAEVALVLREDLAGPGVTPLRAHRAVEGALPALELVDLRYTGKAGSTDIIADGVYANAIVLGTTLTPIGDLDLALEGVVCEWNGAVASTHTAAEVMGHPINALAWMANHLGARGLGMRAGDVVMTGTVSVLVRPKAGDSIRARYTRLGSVSARFV
ncbi:MAG: fumarylacetoacetate hydrolase family protein [Candidatus Rokubacteria bacterium]|nr:fumarylacetoacetate hydrolase family protein [Candidatus Rokubacteria bacterium]